MYQIWIQNDYLEFEKIGPAQSDVDGNLWLQVLGRHFGCEVRLRPVPPKQATASTVSAVSSGLAARALEEAIGQGKAIEIPSLGIKIRGRSEWPGE